MENRNTIVIVSCVFPPEPLVSARISDALARELSKDEEVVVLCPAPTRPVGRTFERKTGSQDKITVVTLDSYTHPQSSVFGRLRESYSFGKAVSRYIALNHYGIKAIYGNTHPTFSQYMLLNAARKYNIPCTLHIQDLYPESLTSKLGLAGRLVNPFLLKIDAVYMRKASRLIAISRNMKETIAEARGIREDKIDLVYNWQEEQRFLDFKPTESESKKFTFMFLGNLNPTADIPDIIKAFGLLSDSSARLVIAGNGSDKARCIETASLCPDVDIVFTEVLPEGVPALQDRADVMILPLLKGISKTAMPSKLPAYLFSAKPVLACVEEDSDVGNAIKESGCGWVVEPENVESLARQMRKCLSSDRKTLKEMGEKGREYGLANFSTKVNLGKLCKAVKKLYV